MTTDSIATTDKTTVTKSIASVRSSPSPSEVIYPARADLVLLKSAERLIGEANKQLQNESGLASGRCEAACSLETGSHVKRTYHTARAAIAKDRAITRWNDIGNHPFSRARTDHSAGGGRRTVTYFTLASK